MATYLVSYDLRKPGRNYDALIAYLKDLGGWAHVLESVWVVTTRFSASDIRDGMRARVDEGDGLFVLKSGVEAAWANALCSNDWLKSNL